MKPVSSFFYALVLGFTALMLTAPIALANSTPTDPVDKNQPIEISADSLDIQEQTGISVYSGNVTITQGRFTLNGDTVQLEHPNQALRSVTAKGQPALFKQFDPKTDTWLNGQADQIVYDVQKQIIMLTGQAKVEQPGHHKITGPQLIYDRLNKTLEAQSTPNEKERISVTLTPESSESTKKANESSINKP